MPPRRMPRSPQSRPRTQTPRSPSSRPHRRTAPIRPLYRAVHKVVFVVVLSMVVVVVSCKRERERERDGEKGRATGFTGLGQRKLAGRGRSRTTRQEPGLGPSVGRGRGVPRETHLRKLALRIHRLLRKPSSSCGSRYSVLVSLTLSLLQRAHRTPSRCRFWFGQTLLAQGGEASSASFPDGKLGLGGIGIQPLNFEIRSAAGKGACVGTSARGRQRSKARVAERLGTMGGATRRSNAYSKIDTETNDGEEALKDAFAHFPPLKVSLPRFATALVLERP